MKDLLGRMFSNESTHRDLTHTHTHIYIERGGCGTTELACQKRE